MKNMENVGTQKRLALAPHNQYGIHSDHEKPKNAVALLYTVDTKDDCDIRRTKVKEGIKLVIDTYLNDRQRSNYHSDLDFFSEIVRKIEALSHMGFTVHYSPIMASCRMNGINYNVTKSSVMVKDRGKNLFFLYRRDSDKLYNVVFDDFQMMSDERRKFHHEMMSAASN